MPLVIILNVSKKINISSGQQTRDRQGQTYLPRHPSQPDLFFYERLAPVFATLLRNTSERESVRPDKHTRSGQVFVEVRRSGRIDDGDTRLSFQTISCGRKLAR